ncbi:MAG: flagellar basal-body MS-ring/collar protein FliF [Henriciella sp.]
MQFIETLKALPRARQIMLAAAVLGVAVAMTFMVRGVMQEPMRLLYSGLDSERSGEILAELDKRGISYELQRDSIFVPQSERDRVRLSLAQDGLPRQSVQGYELLDDVNGFSVTSEMYKASYWRAKEGELTRTILAVPGVDGARVHIGANLRAGFTRTQNAPTASVTLSSSRSISSKQAEGIQYMVALAVPGLNPTDVAVIDSNRGILIGPNQSAGQFVSGESDDKAGALEAKIMSMLEARLGPGNARVSVSVDVSRELQRVASLQIDPESRIIRQRTVTDSAETSTRGGGATTVASNIPDGAAGGGGGESDQRNSSESVAYEFNETRTEIERLPGEIKRISVAVLLNEEALDIPDGVDVAAFTDDVAAEFEQLIVSAAGLEAARGDSVAVELMPFRPVEVADIVLAPSMVETLMEQHLWSGIQLFLLAAVILGLGFGVIRPAFSTKRVGNSLEADFEEDAAEDAAESESDPVRYLQSYAASRQEETAALLQEWLEQDRKAVVND